MFWVVQAQALVTIAISLVEWAISGHHAAVTALVTGMACTVPNGMFAAHLFLLNKWQTISTTQASFAAAQAQQAKTYAILMLFGEFMKVVLTIALLAAVMLGYHHLVWKALLLTLGACMLVQPLAHHWRPKQAQ